MKKQAQNSLPFDLLFKYIMVGSVNCGKTSLLGRFLKPQQKWTDHYEPTLGLEFGSKSINVRNKICKIMVWDTAGQEIFRSIIRSYYKGAIVCLLLFDITNRQSFENCRGWLEQVKANSHSLLKIYLIGTKCDLDHNRNISVQEAQQLVDQLNLCKYFQVSAKQNINILKLFETSAFDIISDLESGKIIINSDSNIGIKINNSFIQNSKINENVSLKNDTSKKDQSGSCQC